MGKDFSKTLKLQSTGEEVKLWQKFLQQKKYFDGTVDGIFGEKTFEATVKYQAANGLIADGIVGKVSWGVAFSDVTVIKPEQIRSESGLLLWIKKHLGPYIQKAITGSVFTEDWLGAIAARETGFLIIRYANKGLDLEAIAKLMKGDFNHNIYNGFSFWQIDIRSFPDFIKSGKWLDIQMSADKAVDVLNGKMKYLKKYEQRLSEHEFARAITAAYNTGEGNVEKSILRNRDVDFTTFNKDYSKEVFRMRKIYVNI